MKLKLSVGILFSLLMVQFGFGQVPTTISYQGVLSDADGNPVTDGDYLIVFRLHDASAGGAQLWEEKQTVTVVNGVFNVILGKVVPLELPFDRTYWLSIELSEDGILLTPRMELTSSAYSLNARAVSDSSVTGRKIAAGAAVRSLNSLSDHVRLVAGDNVNITENDTTLVISAQASGGPTDGWSLTGNAGLDSTNFLGTTDLAPLEIKVNDERVMRYEPGTETGGPNVIGGWSGNSLLEGVVGATISGGGGPLSNSEPRPNRITASYGAIGGGFGNTVSRFNGTVGGGSNNTASDHHATVGGGDSNAASCTGCTVSGGRENEASGATTSTVSGGTQNIASGGVSFVGGGFRNTASAAHTTVGGGVRNVASAEKATVSGGSSNRARGAFATIPGGQLNQARGDYSLAAGYLARAVHEGSFVWSDRVSTSDSTVSTGENQFLIQAAGGVGIGTTTPTNLLSVNGDADFTGEVGIGTNSPAARLEIVSNSLNDHLVLTRGGAGSVHLTATNPSGFSITDGKNNTFFHIRQAGGNVGIGADDPSNILTVVKGSATDPIADAWTTYSSRRWKTNIQRIEGALDKIQRLRGVSYEWKKNRKPDIGLIAEEVGEVVPEVVAYEENGVDAQSVDYARLVAVLIEAVKELSAKVERLERTNGSEFVESQ